MKLITIHVDLSDDEVILGVLGIQGQRVVVRFDRTITTAEIVRLAGPLRRMAEELERSDYTPERVN